MYKNISIETNDGIYYIEKKPDGKLKLGEKIPSCAYPCFPWVKCKRCGDSYNRAIDSYRYDGITF